MDAPHATATMIQPQRHHQQGAWAFGLFLVALLFVGVVWGQPLLSTWLTDSALTADQRAVRTAWFVVGVVAALGSTGLLIAAWLAAMAWRIHRSARHPPPGYPVLRATPLLQGVRAKRQAQWHGLAAAFCVVLCTGVLAYLFHTFPLVETLYVLRP